MKLLNYTLSYLVIALLFIISIWAVIFYFAMLDEIYDSIDDGLANTKLLIIKKALADKQILTKIELGERNYIIKEIAAPIATKYRETYLDSMLYMENEQDYEPVRVLKTAFQANNQKYYELTIVTSMVEEDDLIEDLFFALVWLYLMLILSIFLTNNFLLKRVWRPFHHLLENLKHFKLDQPALLSLQKSKIKEFNSLNETVNNLLQRNIQVFNSQKQFIENAAHELQTPLAISINKLELLAEKMQTEEQLQAIGDILHTLERLTRLNKSLLLLSRIENRQFLEEIPIHFNALAKELNTDFEDLANFKAIQIHLLEEGTLIKPMNKALAEILLTNLIKNAIAHNKPNGFIEIKIQDSGIIISNSSDLAALDENAIFNRFYKNTSENTSTGLGLAIVKAIVSYYGLEIKYTYSQQHTFQIDFL